MSAATRRSGSSSPTGASPSKSAAGPGLADLLSLLRRLEEAHIAYRLERIRDESLAVEVVVPGERWEIEYLETGEVEIEIFRSDGEVLDQRVLNDLFARFAD
jgi:hypothetical protein